MELYRRLTDEELRRLPQDHRSVAEALRSYLDAAVKGAGREELQLLGLALERTILHSETAEVDRDQLRESLQADCRRTA